MSDRHPTSTRRSWSSASSRSTPIPPRDGDPRGTLPHPGAVAEPLVDEFVLALRGLGADVVTGIFGAHMRIDLVNDGPVTVLLEL